MLSTPLYLAIVGALLLLASAATLPMSHPHLRTQQTLLDSARTPYRPTSSNNTDAQYLDAAPNTVGVLFMNSKDEGVHVWLPLGRRVFVRTSNP